MNIFEGKSPAERNKLIAAIVLGALAIIVLGSTLKGLFFPGKRTPVSASSSPTPSPAVKNAAQNPNMPSRDEMDFEYSSIPIVYIPGVFNAPDPGRNVFAFYEPGKPTPYSPTPTPPIPPAKTPPPTPTPDIFVAYATPQSVYAGSNGFRLDVSGDKFTHDSVVLFDGRQIPTNYISPQNIFAQISDGLIAFPGIRTITVITPAGKYSNLISLNVQEPPKPQFRYIGLISRKRFNNDTAYFDEPGKETPFGARLNDVVGGRFRLKSISSEEVVFEDVNLGFKHKLALNRPVPGTTAGSLVGNPRPGVNNPFPTYNPANPNLGIPQGDIPGIPSNIPRYVPTPLPQNQKQDVDDEDGDDKPLT